MRKGTLDRDADADCTRSTRTTGREELWREFFPADATGVNGLIAFRNAPNGAYAYSYFRNLSNLYLVEGLN